MSPADWTHAALSQQQANALADRTTAANKEGTWLLMYPGQAWCAWALICIYASTWQTD